MAETPDFATPFAVEAADAASISLRHRDEGHWWRFDVAEKNGRLQLLHGAHRANQDASQPIETYALDAYDAATREARRRGLVD